MAREQPNVGDLLPLLETSDLQQLEAIRGLLNEQLSTERGSMLLNGLVDYFLETNSAQALHILSSVREPHDKHLLDKMNDCMTKQACRLPTLLLLGHVVRRQPSWIHKVARYPLLLSLLKCLKTDTDVAVLITGVLVLITLLPMIPQAGKQHLWEYFDIFGRLASWNLKNPGHVSEVYLIHLHASVYSLFHRLYGMYPCNFVSYLRSHYSMKENVETFEEVVKPMLEHVRVHPELVTGTKDHELDPTRWKRYEIHDIVIECAKVSLDPKEASCEEGYLMLIHRLIRLFVFLTTGSSSSTPFSTPRQPLPPPLSLPPFSGTQSSCRSPQTSRRQNSTCELNSSCGGKDPLWSPSSLCGMATPPSSRGMSPNLELSHSSSLLPSRFHCTSGTSLIISRSDVNSRSSVFVVCPHISKTQNATEDQKNRSHKRPVGLTDMDVLNIWFVNHLLFIDAAAITEELLKLTEEKLELPGLRGFDSPFYRTTETLTGSRAPDKTARSALEHPCSKMPAPVPYESLFDLALPRAASLFVGQKTSEVVHKAALERLLQREEGLEDGEEEGVVSASPLEVLDRLVQQGSDAHDKLEKGGFPSPGSAPLDELHTLRSQLFLLHNQLLYERYKREQHAVRNRRLLRRIINATALEEQNNAMKDQLNLQSVDITSLRESLQVEQQRYRQLWDDRELVVTRLHSQIRQLQQSRDDYYTKNQELQSKSQECQKRLDELEAELQRANNKVCHTGHLLNQMMVKLSNSESTQQQMSFLNKQLLLLGEAHKLSMQEQQHTSTSSMLQVSYMKEVETLRLSLLAQGQKLEAAQQRVAELETHLSKKEHLIAEQKKFLEDVKGQAKAELQASDCRYHAQRRITQLLQTELLQLYSRVEMEAPAPPTSSSCTHHSPRGNGSTLSSGQPKVSSSSKSTASSMNGDRDLTPPLLVVPSPSCTHASPLASLPASDAPLTVGSYPSAKSFLGMKARELFRNKSESQCDDDDDQPPPRLAGLAHDLKTELCVESRSLGAARPRQQQLKIMDYNETHHEHS
uniref:TSC complex subunit 1b n=1 Tax=Nothobranchius furzeri TaxID=105023 RepID=A0A8C6KUD5_NOTFU